MTRLGRRRHLGRRALVLGLVLAVAWYGLAWVRRIPSAPVVAIAHRGAPASTGEPENTLPAFEAAIRAGAGWLEFDVRATQDGVLVVLHDETVDRTTDGTGRVTDLTFERVRALDAGKGARIPTVQEVIRAAKAARIQILAEIKDGPRYPEVVGHLVDLLRAENYLDWSVITAFEPETLVTLRRLAPDARAGWIAGPFQLDLSSPPADAAFVCPMAEMILLDPDMIRAAHAAGRTVFAWWGTAETAATDRILVEYGVDGLIVNDLRPLVGG